MLLFGRDGDFANGIFNTSKTYPEKSMALKRSTAFIQENFQS